MKFVDLNTGCVYNGNIPYIHWFDDKQSTNLIYIKKLCIVDAREFLNVNLDSSIFTLLNMDDVENLQDINVNDFSYKDIKKLRTKNYKSTGHYYNIDQNNIYIHVIYIEASSDIEGEFLEDLYIEDEKFTIGASFWPEYEPHKINLSNFGVEFSEDIYRAIYETNVHEESIDYITLNRKRKELLLNYWDIVAAKGSYKSLYDSLSWFEYGDLVKIQEFWKNKNDRLFQQDITQTLDEFIKQYLLNHSKTTYIGLYATLNNLNIVDGEVQYEKKVNILHEVTDDQGNTLGAITNTRLNIPLPEDDSPDQIFQIGIVNDSVNIEDDSPVFQNIDPSDWYRVTYESYNGLLGEEVPELVKIAAKWSADDLSLKMYLLGRFYETNFMPIHMDLIHSTVERIVFTNTIKILQSANICRHDYYNNIGSFKCNIKDGSCFYLENVNCQVNYNTPLGVQWYDQNENSSLLYNTSENQLSYNIRPIGVEKTIEQLQKDEFDSYDSDLKTFTTQYYNGIGKMVNFVCEIDTKYLINKADIVIAKIDGDYNRKGSFKYLLNPINDIVVADFNILFEEEGSYIVELSFTNIDGETFTRIIKLNILDYSVRTLKVYKVVRNTKPEHNNMLKPSDYIFSSYRGSNCMKTFTIASDLLNYKGVGFQRCLVYKLNSKIFAIPIILKQNFDIIRKTDNYLYLLSKHFDSDYTDVSKISTSFGTLIKDEYVYVPQNHHLEEIGGNKLQDYQITKYDTLMVVPDIKYLKEIEDSQWIVENISTKNSIEPIEIKYTNRPYLTDENRTLERGFYNITFKYLLGNKQQEVSLNSAFQVV